MSGQIPDGPINVSGEEMHRRVTAAYDLIKKYVQLVHIPIFVDYETDLNNLEAYIQLWLIECYKKSEGTGNIEDFYPGVHALMYAVQTAFVLGRESLKAEQAIESNLPDSIKDL
jgi:hypothetical protein